MELGGVESLEVLGGDELGGAGVVHEHIDAAQIGLDLGSEAAAVGVEGDVGLDHQHLAPAARHSAATASPGASTRE